MRRVLLAVVAIAVLSGCSEGAVLRWLTLKAQAPDVAAQVLADHEALRARWTEGRPCPELFDAFAEAGFQPEEWPTMSRLADRESHCQPDPLGGHRLSDSGDAGAWQINRVWFGGLMDAGIIDTVDDLFDPYMNAQAAFYVKQRQGYGAWSTF